VTACSFAHKHHNAALPKSITIRGIPDETSEELAARAALIDHGPVGEWAEAMLLAGPLAAPHLIQDEVANILRRSTDQVTAAGGPAATAFSAVRFHPVQQGAE